MKYLGVDIGSSASKAVIVDNEGVVVARWLKHTGVGVATDVIETVLAETGTEASEIACTVATGYGRKLVPGADEEIAELSCHAKGARALVPKTRTIIDIGGQDAKAISLDGYGRIQSFAMNDKCAAGTGRFLEVMAHVLGVGTDALPDLAAASGTDIRISNTCTVFAESEVISQLAGGGSKADIAKGIHASVAERIAGLAKRVDIVPVVCMTGGSANNSALAACIGKELGAEIVVPEWPQMAGALGAALYARAIL
ncbi:MAG: acyl-CoA dehydratase activase [Clostridiales Family XIII bacterium]|jgi:predicted CoA-substrate-specific enzyme activase|nr:acyl-CoA dehydratase activase [Clostridiales Family XIII bacterium]